MPATSAEPPTITTVRLMLRPVTVEDASALYHLHQDEAIARWFGETWSLERAATETTRMAAAWHRAGHGKWLAYLRSSGDLVGRGGLGEVRLGTEEVEVGWAVRERYSRRGLATEIGAAALDYGFTTLARDSVVAFTEADNLASRAVMEKLGMRYEREIPRPDEDLVRSGVRLDTTFVLYRIDRSSGKSSGHCSHITASWPPSTTSSAPVMNDASSEERNA